MGNVTGYRGMTFTWTAGRQLESITGADNGDFTYYYNADGNIEKCVLTNPDDPTDTVTVTYIWDGDRLVCREYDAGDEVFRSRILYDTDGEPVGVIVNDSAPMLYMKNLQGDILGIADPGGEELLKFSYDAYGMPYVTFTRNENNTNTPQAATIDDFISGAAQQLLGAGLGVIFGVMLTLMFVPQGYRGYTYVFMGNTVGYYCGSRFYMPELGRFLNADVYPDTGTGVVGTNMFAYCNNNPVMFVDPDGEDTTTADDNTLGIFGVIMAVFSLFAYLIKAVQLQPISIPSSAGSLYAFTSGELQTWKIRSLTIVDNWLNNEYYLSQQVRAQIRRAYVSLLDKMAKSLEKQKLKGKNIEAIEVHHIVAKKHWKAQKARNYLESCKIKTSDGSNLVGISYVFHRHLHNYLYFELINLIVESYYNVFINYNLNTKDFMRSLLEFIGQQLISIDSVLCSLI